MHYPKCNLHTHSRFCDGADTPEETVCEALRLGMETLGFSGHSCTDFDPHYCMSLQDTVDYKQEIYRLKAVYGDRLRILCGIEQDFYSAAPAEGFDYVIGSVHYVYRDGIYHPVDHSADQVREFVKTSFGGDIYKYVKAYFETVAQVVEKTDCGIIGHFDLLEKFNYRDAMFSTDDYRYRRPLIDALDALLEKDVIFEINTGAIARGYQKIPYPSPYALYRIAEKRGRVLINSDAHKKENLMYGFHDAMMYARACGIGGLTVWTPDGWVVRPLGGL